MKKLFLLCAILSLNLFAQETKEAKNEPQPSNGIYIHPFFLGITAANKQFPVILVTTYEKYLVPNTSLIVSPWLIFGDFEATNSYYTIDRSIFEIIPRVGLRQYFFGNNRGLFVQGTGHIDYAKQDAKIRYTKTTAKSSLFGYGGAATIGYKWDYVFFDLGWIFSNSKGTEKYSDGTELEVEGQGQGPDINLGFGFVF